MEAQAQSVLAEEDQQEVIYLVVDENPQGQQVTQIVSDGQLIGQQAQIIMQDGKQAVLITDGNQQQVVLLDDEVGPEQLQSALHHGAVQQNVLQQPPVSVIMTQPQSAASTSTANGGQVQYLVTEGGEIISPITQVNQPVVTIASQQPPQQQQHHQLVVTQSGLVRISGGSNKKDGGIVPGKSLINQAALKEAAAKSPRGRLEDQVLIMGASGEAVKTQLSEQTTLRQVIGEAVDKQITGMVPTEPAPVVPTTDVATPTTDMDLAIADANAEINSTGVNMDAKESKDETDTIGFTEETNTDMAEAVEPDSTQSGCTDTVNGSLDKDMMNSVTAVDGSSMVSVSSDIPPLAALPDQVMEDDEENRSADEAKNMQVPQVFNMPDQTMELNASEIFHEKEQVETKLTSDDSATEGNATEQNIVAKPTSTLIIHDPQGKKPTQQQEVMPSTVITVISPQSKKKKRRYDIMRQEEEQLGSPQQNSAKATKMGGDSIASRRERRTSKPTRYYGLEVDYEVYTADIYRSYRRGSESGDEVAVSKAKKEQRKNIEDNFGFDIPSTDDEQPPEKKKAITKPKKSEITQSTKETPLLPGEPTPVHNTTPVTDVAEGAKITVKEVVQQPIKRGRGRPPKHPKKIKAITPKKVEQVETSASKEIAVEDKVSKPVETLAADQSEETSLKTGVVAADVEPPKMENGLDGLEDVLKKDDDGTTSTSEFLVEEEKVLPKADELETEQITLNVHENEVIDALMTPDSAEGGEDDSVLMNRDSETLAAETSEESVLGREPVKDVETPVISPKMASESETGDEKMDDNTFAKPTKRGSVGRPRGRTKKSTGPSGQPAKRSSQSDGESPRRSVRTKEKPCYAESSEEEGQEAVDVPKAEVITPEQLREESNKVYSLQKEVTDLKFINDSLELRLAQQSGSPEEIRSLQARVDSLQMRNNELEAKVKNYEKSQKIGINIKGMKFSIKKDSTSSQVKSKPTDVVRLKEIELAEQELRVRETQLEKRELKARALDRELDERGAQLTKRESKLDRWERKLRSQEKEIEYKERRLKRLENDLQDLGGTGGRHKHFDYVEDTELIVQQKDLRMWEDELRQREAEMLEKEKLLAATEKQLMALNTELNEKAEYLQAKEQSHSSGDEGSLTDISEDRIKRTPFKARHSEGSKKTKGRRQNSPSSLLMTWKRSTPTSEVVGLPSHLPSKSSTPRSSAKSTPKTTGSAKATSTGKRKACTDSKNSTPASVKRQKTTPKSSGKKKILKSPAFKANKEKTPKSRKSEGKVQKKKLASNVKSPKTTSKAKRK